MQKWDHVNSRLLDQTQSDMGEGAKTHGIQMLTNSATYT